MTRRIITMAMAWIGHVRGGLGYVAVAAAAIMVRCRALPWPTPRHWRRCWYP